MILEPIVRRDFPQPDRTEIQERIAQQVEREPETFLAHYRKNPRSFRGRYVNSDLMKEAFPEYRESRETRNLYNAPVHNAAAVLASEQYRRVVCDNSEPGPQPRYVLDWGSRCWEDHLRSPRRVSWRATCESCMKGSLQMSPPAIAKIEMAPQCRAMAEITVVHMPAERALRNTLHRFATEGRGASIEAIARIQGGLPEAFGPSMSTSVSSRICASLTGEVQ